MQFYLKGGVRFWGEIEGEGESGSDPNLTSTPIPTSTLIPILAYLEQFGCIQLRNNESLVLRGQTLLTHSDPVTAAVLSLGWE